MKLPNAKVGFSKAMSNGWVLVDKSINPPLVKRKVPEIKDLVLCRIFFQLEHLTLLYGLQVQEQLKLLATGQPTELSDKEKADYKKRKLIQESIIKSFVLRKGPDFSLTLNKLETDLTTEMLASGSWKSLKFKDYNLDALGQRSQ